MILLVVCTKKYELVKWSVSVCNIYLINRFLTLLLIRFYISYKYCLYEFQEEARQHQTRTATMTNFIYLNNNE